MDNGGRKRARDDSEDDERRTRQKTSRAADDAKQAKEEVDAAPATDVTSANAAALPATELPVWQRTDALLVNTAIVRQFFTAFDGGVNEGNALPIETLHYFNSMRASIKNDEFFQLMMRNAWHISGGEGWSANTTCRRVLVTHSDGRQTVEQVRNDMNVTANDNEAIRANLQAQGITDVQAVETKGSYIEIKIDADKRSADPFRLKYPTKKPFGAVDSAIAFGTS